MALLYLVILFVLLGVLASAGTRMIGSLVVQGKTKDTKAGLERDVRMITTWAVRNGRLPIAGEYAGVFGGAPLDAWGRQIVYACDDNLTSTASGGLCGRTAATGQEAAFLLISGGDDMRITAAPAIIGGALTASVAAEDMYRLVTLKELQAQAGCSGSAQGSLRIVNNELPHVCKGINYSASIFGDGGVPPVSYSFSGLPAGLVASGATISGSTSSAQGGYPVVVSATDSQAPTATTIQRKYILKVMSSCTSN